MHSLPIQPWLDRAKANTDDFFDKKRQMIFRFAVADPNEFMSLEGLAATKSSIGKTILNHKLDLEIRLAALEKRFATGYEDDFVYSIQPYTGVGLFALAGTGAYYLAAEEFKLNANMTL